MDWLAPLQLTGSLVAASALFILRFILVPVSALIELVHLLLLPAIYTIQYALVPVYFVFGIIPALEVRSLAPALSFCDVVPYDVQSHAKPPPDVAALHLREYFIPKVCESPGR